MSWFLCPESRDCPSPPWYPSPGTCAQNPNTSNRGPETGVGRGKALAPDARLVGAAGRRPEAVFANAKRLLAQGEAETSPAALAAARRLQAARPTPMNIDGDAAQMTLADCLFLTDTQQLMAESSSYTQSELGSLDAQVAISYNPNLDYWPGTSTPRVDPKDAVYCVNYVVKRWRVVYDASLTCAGSAGEEADDEPPRRPTDFFRATPPPPEL